jgi:hypothetical protein
LAFSEQPIVSIATTHKALDNFFIFFPLLI